MHTEAYKFISETVRQLSVLEIGSLDVNGSIRDLFPFWNYTGIDCAPGKGVDVVADGATFTTSKRYDVVVSCEAFEHAANWRDVIANVAKLIRPGGAFMGTAAGPGRKPHKCDGTDLDDGSEYYANVEPVELKNQLIRNGFADVIVNTKGEDVRWNCRKGS